MDLFIPGMDGYQVLEILGNSPLYSEILIIVFSVKGNLQGIEQAIDLGAIEYIVKGKVELEKMVPRLRKSWKKEREGVPSKVPFWNFLSKKGL